MSEEFINTSDCDEEEMKQLFEDSNGQKDDQNNTFTCDMNKQSDNIAVVPSQSERKKKTQRKSTSRQTSGKVTDNFSKSVSSRKGRQSKTPSGSQQGRHSCEGDFNTSPCRDGLPIFTNDIHVADNTFKLSLLDEVLTEKKMALMRSPEVVQFLKEQQTATASKNKNENS